jgi:hypothetical protein
MTDEVKNEETTPSEPELPTFDTAFLVIKATTGNWHVLTDLSVPLKIDREATVNEVRQGAAEVTYALSQQQLATLVAAAITPKSEDTTPEPETESTIKE